LVFGLLSALCAFGQRDTSKIKHPEINLKPYTIRELEGTSIAAKVDSLLQHQFRYGGYVSTYYAYYDADEESNGFVLFPTLAPRNNNFSLNMALLNFDYNSANARAAITLHYGDVPASSWPTPFNAIQEARAGFKILKKFWLDAGFFKTHIGLESFQPRENITSSMSIPNYYDPYYLSGAKLTYMASKKLILQVGIFNGYNEYIDNNKNKALDFSLNFNPNKDFSLTYNFLTCDETPDNNPTKHQRYYQNFYASYYLKKLTLGIDLNFGMQQNSLYKDTTKLAYMFGGILVGQYQLSKLWNAYGRLEYFSDENRILTGSLDIGKYIHGTTLGIELKPIPTAGISVEWRVLDADKTIFKNGNYLKSRRDEFIICLDLWF